MGKFSQRDGVESVWYGVYIWLTIYYIFDFNAKWRKIVGGIAYRSIFLGIILILSYDDDFWADFIF